MSYDMMEERVRGPRQSPIQLLLVLDCHLDHSPLLRYDGAFATNDPQNTALRHLHRRNLPYASSRQARRSLPLSRIQPTASGFMTP